METLAQVLAKHAFFKDMASEHLQFIAECASEGSFETGQYILREEEEANHCYLIRRGTVALGTYIPGRGFTKIETLDAGEILGWSWLIPPYHWHFSALTLEPTQTIVFDGEQLRQQCEEDHDFGYELLSRLALIIGQRLRATRMRLD